MGYLIEKLPNGKFVVVDGQGNASKMFDAREGAETHAFRLLEAEDVLRAQGYRERRDGTWS